MIRKLTKIGNSSGVLIPRQLLEVLGWDTDTNLKLTAQGDTLHITPATVDQHLDLLFEGMNNGIEIDGNVHVGR